MPGGFTDWETFGPFGQNDSAITPPPPEFDFSFWNVSPATAVGTGTKSITYRMTESITAGMFVRNDLDARLCCLRHAMAGHSGSHGSWDPGECLTIGSPGAGVVGFPAGAFGAAEAEDGMTRDFTVGSTAVWQVAFVFVPSNYSVAVAHPRGVAYRAVRNAPTDIYRGVPLGVLVQIPGWLDFVLDVQDEVGSDGVGFPEVEPLRVDARTWIEVGSAQAVTNDTFDVSAHPLAGSPPATVTPYGSLSAAEWTVSGTGGASSVTVHEDIPAPWGRYWDFSSSRVAAEDDPGVTPGATTDGSILHLASARLAAEYLWTVRIRFPEPDEEPPLRWRQRDDGLGVGSARRARGGSSRQSSKRHRGGYRMSPATT